MQTEPLGAFPFQKPTPEMLMTHVKPDANFDLLNVFLFLKNKEANKTILSKQAMHNIRDFTKTAMRVITADGTDLKIITLKNTGNESPCKRIAAPGGENNIIRQCIMSADTNYLLIGFVSNMFCVLYNLADDSMKTINYGFIRGYLTFAVSQHAKYMIIYNVSLSVIFDLETGAPLMETVYENKAQTLPDIIHSADIVEDEKYRFIAMACLSTYFILQRMVNGTIETKVLTSDLQSADKYGFSSYYDVKISPNHTFAVLVTHDSRFFFIFDLIKERITNTFSLGDQTPRYDFFDQISFDDTGNIMKLTQGELSLTKEKLDKHYAIDCETGKMLSKQATTKGSRYVSNNSSLIYLPVCVNMPFVFSFKFAWGSNYRQESTVDNKKWFLTFMHDQSHQVFNYCDNVVLSDRDVSNIKAVYEIHI